MLCDLHTFGSPRLGGVKGNDWADTFKKKLDDRAAGKSWRFVNEQDPVPDFFPVEGDDDTWNHVDTGYHIFSNAFPKLLETEIGTKPAQGPGPLNIDSQLVPMHCARLILALSPAECLES